MAEPGPVKVGIAGAGAVAFGNAALLMERGHNVMLWSPSGARTRALADGAALAATGAIDGEFHPNVAACAQDLVDFADVVLIALPAYGHQSVMDALAPFIGAGQSVIISSHASFSALYLSQLLAQRDIAVPIVAWGTTMTTGRQTGASAVQVNTVRARVDMCTVPERFSDAGLQICEHLFGEKFIVRDGLLAISLSNLNPQNHMGIALANMTRMEHGETWSQGFNVTPNVGRLLEALDRERLAIAEALDLTVRTIFEHFHLSFHVPVATISEMNQAMHERGSGGSGPTTADSRYVTEDVPYGLAVTAGLGDMAGRPATLHKAGVSIFSAMYGRDFLAENTLLQALALERMTLENLREICRTGFSHGQAANFESVLQRDNKDRIHS